MSLITYFRSPYLISIQTDDAHWMLDFLIAHNIPFQNQKNNENTFSVLLYPPYYKTYCRLRGKRRYRKEAAMKETKALFLHRISTDRPSVKPFQRAQQVMKVSLTSDPCTL